MAGEPAKGNGGQLPVREAVLCSQNRHKVAELQELLPQLELQGTASKNLINQYRRSTTQDGQRLPPVGGVIPIYEAAPSRETNLGADLRASLTLSPRAWYAVGTAEHAVTTTK